MIFQDPASALNPVLTIGKQIGEALRAASRPLGRARSRAEARRLLDLVGIPDAARRLDAYPHEFSGGQNQRVMIAMALAGKPDLLIADEPTTALDATIQAQILDLIGRVRREIGMALVLISHDLGVVAEICDRVAVMYAGRIVEEAPAERAVRRPAPSLHAGPDRRAAAARRPAPPADRDPGHGARPGAMPRGCAFAPRCAVARSLLRPRLPRLRRDRRGRAGSPACCESRRPSASAGARPRNDGAARRGRRRLRSLPDARRPVRPRRRGARRRRRLARHPRAARRSASSASPAPANRPPAAWCSGSKQPDRGSVRFDGAPMAAAGTPGLARAARAACR